MRKNHLTDESLGLSWDVMKKLILCFTICLVLIGCNDRRKYEESVTRTREQIIESLCENALLERLFFWEYNRQIFERSPALNETLSYEYGQIYVEVNYIALESSGEILLRSRDASLIVGSEHIRFPDFFDSIRIDTLWLKTDTVVISIIGRQLSSP